MDPATISAVIEQLVTVVGAVHTLVKALHEYKQSLRAVDELTLFLDTMAAVLKEQRLDRVPPSGLRILQAIETECLSIQSTMSTFLQRNRVIKAITASSTVAKLQDCRVKLHEYWTLYLAALCSAGAAPAPGAAEPPPLTQDTGHAGDATTATASPSLSQHMNCFWVAVSTLSSRGTGAAAAEADRRLLKLSQHPLGDMTDAQERRLAAVVTQLQRQLAERVPADLFVPAADARTRLHEMHAAMERSFSAGMADLKAHLELISKDIANIAAGTQETLDLMKKFGPAFEAVAFGTPSRSLTPEERALLQQHEAAVQREECFVVDKSMMACPASGLPFSLEGSTAPTLVPGCGCVVAQDIAEVYRRNEECGVCRQFVPADGELKLDQAALVFLDDLRNGRFPAIPKFDVESGFVEEEGGQQTRRVGSEGVVRRGTLRGRRVAVKTIEFAQPGASTWQWRCRRHVLLNSICMQQCAARASEYVCEVVGLCWEETRAHIAMPLYDRTLEEHTIAEGKRAIPLHRVLGLCCALTRAVYDVHKCGILHCDITPANVLLADDGTPRLADFGLSHIDRNGLKTRTSLGHTMLYAAPEQVNGVVNKATDIYALGRTLAFAATGVRPSPSGQKMPQEPPELRRQLEQLTGSQDTRRQISLVQVIGVFEGLLSKHGPAPLASVQSIEALSARLAFGDDVDLGSREISLASSPPADRSATRPQARTQMLSGGLAVITWSVQAAPHAACWDLTQHGAVLCNVTLRIPQHGRLHVLAGDSPGTWRNVTVLGAEHSAVVMGGEMTLESVTFDGCTLEATHDAAVEASNCCFSNARLAVCAIEGGTAVKLRACRVRDCHAGVVAIGGASITVTSETEIRCKGDACCVSALGSSSTVTVSDGSSLSFHAESASSDLGLWLGCATAVHGGTVRIHETRLSVAEGLKNVGGVLAHGEGTTATLSDCHIHASADAISAVAGGQVTLRNSAVAGGQRGLCAAGAQARIEATECAVSKCVRNCATALYGGHLKLVRSSFCSSAAGSGVRVHGSSTSADLKDCTVALNAGGGVYVGGGAAANVQGGKAERNNWDGLCVCEGSAAELTGFSMLSSKHGGGVIVKHQKSRVRAVGCDFSNNELHGARAYEGGMLRAEGCTASENGSRSVYSAYAAIAAEGSRGQKLEHPGRSALLADKAEIDASACGFFAHGETTKVFAEQSCMAVRNCAGGFVAACGAELVVSESEASSNGWAGAALRRAASATLTKSKFKDSAAGSGVELYDSGTSATMSDCIAESNGGCGVCVRSGASLTVHALHASDNQDDGLLLVGCAATVSGTKQASTAEVKSCTAESNGRCGILVRDGAALTLHAWHALNNAEDGLLVVGHDSKAEGAQSESLTTAECIARGNSKCGVRVKDGAKINMHALNASGNTDDGLLVVGSGSTASGTQTGLTHFKAQDNGRCGVRVQDGAVLTVHALHALGNKGDGVLLDDSVRTDAESKSAAQLTATLTDCSAKDNASSGVRVCGGATVRMHAVHASGNTAAGLRLEGTGSSASAGSVTVTANRGRGVHVRNFATLAAERCSAAKNVLAGVHVQESGVARIQSAHVSGTVSGSGVIADSAGAALLLFCEITGSHECGLLAKSSGRIKVSSHMASSRVVRNRQSNVHVQSNGFALLDDVILSKSRLGDGVSAKGEGSSAVLVNCTLAENGACGAAMHAGASLMCQQSIVAANANVGVDVSTGGRAQLSKSSVKKTTDGSGMIVRGEGSFATLLLCEVAENAGAGIEVREAAKADVQRTSTAKNARAGASVDHTSRLEMRACMSQDEVAFLAPKVKGCIVRVDCTPR